MAPRSRLELGRVNDHEPENCPFDQGQVRDSTILESSDYALIANIAPILPGHSLVIPKRHVESLMGLDEEEVAALFIFARRVTKMLTAIFEADGFNWSLQDGPPAGQSVGHLHLHLIPRYDGDLPRPGDWYPQLQKEIGDSNGEIDSDQRPRFSDDELRVVTTVIRERAEALGVVPTL